MIDNAILHQIMKKNVYHLYANLSKKEFYLRSQKAKCTKFGIITVTLQLAAVTLLFY